MNNVILPSLLVLGAGLVCCFFGYGVWRLALVIAGFFIGYQVGVAFVPPGQWGLAGVAGLVTAIVIGALAYFLYSVSIIIAGGLFGASLGTTVLAVIAPAQAGSGAAPLIAVGIGLVAGVLLAAVFKDTFIMLLMAAAGAGAVVYGLLMLLSTLGEPPAWSASMLLWIGLFVGLGIAGFAVQVRRFGLDGGRR